MALVRRFTMQEGEEARKAPKADQNRGPKERLCTEHRQTN